MIQALGVGNLVLASAPVTVVTSGATTQLIVKFKDGVSSTAEQTSITTDGGQQVDTIDALGLHIIAVPSAALNHALGLYKNDKNVDSVDVDQTRAVTGVPSDPAYSSQWALPMIGWDTVYNAAHPGGGATIAVLDTGTGSAGGDISVGSGYSAFPPNDPTNDPNGHGTAVASIAAAATDNGAGIAGVDLAGATILPVQVLDSNGTGNDSNIIKGIVWAANHGADVILMAFDGTGFSQGMQSAVNYAWSKGTVLVAATGNGGSSTPTFPAGDAGVMGVSGTDSSGSTASAMTRATRTRRSRSQPGR